MRAVFSSLLKLRPLRHGKQLGGGAACGSHRDKVATIFEVAVDWEPLIPKREAQKRGFGLVGELL